MKKGDLELDLSDLFAKLEQMTDKEAKKVRRSAMMNSMGVLKRATDDLYRRRTKLASRKDMLPRKGKPGKSKTVFDWKKNVAKVHIMQDFMMRWFEMGTKKRYTHPIRSTVYENGTKKRISERSKRSRYTGRIKPMRLFMQAQGQVEQKIIDELDMRIARAIQNVWKKRQK